MNFKPMNAVEFETLVAEIMLNNGTQQARIQHALLQATFATFATDYRFAGKDGAANYDAPYMNAIMDVMEKARGVDVHAIAKWVSAFAPVQFDKATGYFTINKQKVDKLALYLVKDADEQANSFWTWATTAAYKAHVTGSTDEKLYAPTLNWYELDGATRSLSKAEFSSESLERRLGALVKECVKAGLDESAEILAKMKSEAVAAAKMKEIHV